MARPKRGKGPALEYPQDQEGPPGQLPGTPGASMAPRADRKGLLGRSTWPRTHSSGCGADSERGLPRRDILRSRPDARRPRQLPSSTVRPPTARAYSCCIFMPTTGRGAGTRPSPPGHLRGLLPSAPEAHRSFQCASSSAARGTELRPPGRQGHPRRQRSLLCLRICQGPRLKPSTPGPGSTTSGSVRHPAPAPPGLPLLPDVRPHGALPTCCSPAPF